MNNNGLELIERKDNYNLYRCEFCNAIVACTETTALLSYGCGICGAEPPKRKPRRKQNNKQEFDDDMSN